MYGVGHSQRLGPRPDVGASAGVGDAVDLEKLEHGRRLGNLVWAWMLGVVAVGLMAIWRGRVGA